MLPDVLVAVRAFPRYRMLMLALERMGIANPAVYAAAARHAARLSDLGAERGFVALGQFQGALAILARQADAQVLDAARAESLVTSLSAVPLTGWVLRRRHRPLAQGLARPARGHRGRRRR